MALACLEFWISALVEWDHFVPLFSFSCFVGRLCSGDWISEPIGYFFHYVLRTNKKKQKQKWTIATHYENTSHDRKMSVVPIDRRLCFPTAVPTPTVGDGRRTVGTTDTFL